MKKFLTVLLALSVVFTYSFSAVGSVFAAESATKQDSVDALKAVVEEAQKKISYDGYNYMTTNDSKINGILSKTVVEEGIQDLYEKYLTEIDKATSAWDATWTDVNTADKFLSVLFENAKTGEYKKIGNPIANSKEWKADTYYAIYKQDDGKVVTAPATYENAEALATAIKAARKEVANDETSQTAVSTYVVEFVYANSYAKLIDAQYDIDKAAAKEALDPELKGYTEDAKAEIISVIEAQTKAYNEALAKDKVEAITDFRAIVTAMAKVLKDQPTDQTAAQKLADAKKDVVKTLDEASADFIEAIKTAEPKTASQVAQQKSVVGDVSKMVKFFEDKIDAVLADEKTTDTVKTNTLNSIKGVIAATFAKTATFNAEFYNDLKVLERVDLLTIYAQDVAADKKAERKSDGTLKYAAKDVDKAYNDAIQAIAKGAYDDIKTAGTVVSIDKTTVDKEMAKIKEQEYPLQAYKEDAIDSITTTDYELSNWSGERAGKVAAIQEKAEEDILLAETIEDVDAIVKKAVSDMDAILNDNQIDALESTTDNRVKALGYADAMDKYYDAIVGSKGYTLTTKHDAKANAMQVLRDAVTEKENADLTRAEIDTIIKENYDKALAELVNVKTAAELAEAAKAVDALITALPKTIALTDKEQVLAAQNAFDDYLALPGTKALDVKGKLTLDKAMSDLMYLEAKAVRDQIRALPDVVTVADAEKIEAARAAYDALEETYGDYGIDMPADSALVAAEKALETAKVKEAADKIAALGANPTKAEVEAARAAYDALSTRSKLKFNEELYADLLKAEKEVVSSGIYAVKSLKITTSTKLYKGSKIRVKWTVKGDASVADGYQVYKSTKAHKNYKFMGKTKKSYMDNKKNLKKGTRYFYKVRAYKVVDGVKYYSDWSNKGNRIYKK